MFGTGDPDDTVVAVDANTGAQVWWYQAGLGTDSDVGAGPTITAPGVNGFPDGEVYIPSKFREIYALNLKTGTLDWLFSVRNDAPKAGGAPRSTAAILGNQLFLGYGAGLYDLNATTGARIWKSPTDLTNPVVPDVISSPALTGPTGSQVLLFGDMGGSVRAYSLTGHQLWSYNTGAFIYSSPAVAVGHVFITSSNGLLYAFTVGATSSAKPSATITTPVANSTVVNTGTIQATGTATDDTGVAGVRVGIKNVATGRWWDATTRTWSSVFQQVTATLGSPGSTSTTWSTTVPAPAAGGNFLVQADTVDVNGQRDPNLPTIKFNLTSLTNPPDTVILAPTFRQIFHPPMTGICNPECIYTLPYYIAISGTATDVQGIHPGVTSVKVTVRNIQHGDYFCGAAGCPGEPDSFWQPAPISFLATLGTPGAASTTWNTQFLIYDHQHQYRITATAVDADKNVDPVPASVNKICVNDTGYEVCL